jgi:hypothetical protein
MRVCAAKQPVDVEPAEAGSGGGEAARPETGRAFGAPRGRRVQCWLHGPESEIPPGETAELERRELAHADEA